VIGCIAAASSRDQSGDHWQALILRLLLDILWLSEDRRIVDIKENAPPCENESACPTYTPKGLARYILELNAGESSRLHLATGDEARFEFPVGVLVNK
jgi:uncharacterized membrane protein (UPF0127 family)